MKVSEVKIPGETNSVIVDAWPDAEASERGDHGRVWLWSFASCKAQSLGCILHLRGSLVPFMSLTTVRFLRAEIPASSGVTVITGSALPHVCCECPRCWPFSITVGKTLAWLAIPPS